MNSFLENTLQALSLVIGIIAVILVFWDKYKNCTNELNDAEKHLDKLLNELKGINSKLEHTFGDLHDD